jgi:Ca2+/Na+ antiporter
MNMLVQFISLCFGFGLLILIFDVSFSIYDLLIYLLLFCISSWFFYLLYKKRDKNNDIDIKKNKRTRMRDQLK